MKSTIGPKERLCLSGVAAVCLGVACGGGGEECEHPPCDTADAGCESCEPASPVDDVTELLVDGSWLEARLVDDCTQIVDVRGEGEFATAHIPGAMSLPFGDLLTEVDGVAQQVVASGAAQDALRSAGVCEQPTVVVYGNEVDPYSARVFWTFEYVGHADVRLLDGGFSAWRSAEREEEIGDPAAAATSYTIEGLVDARRVEAEWVLEHLEDPNVVLIDGRTSGEFAGGHIPGALNVPMESNMIDGQLADRAAVAALYSGLDAEATVVAYCQYGTRSSVTYFALRWLGFADVRLYDGSWEEWSNRTDLPTER